MSIDSVPTRAAVRVAGALALAATLLGAAATGLLQPAPAAERARPSATDCADAALGCVPNPAELGAAEAERLYQSLRDTLQAGYAASDDPLAQAYAGWRRYNRAPFRSDAHGSLFVNVYANPAAAAAGVFDGPLPAGSLLAQDSFSVTAGRAISAGPLAVMEKMPPGFDPPNGDWRFLLITPEGRLIGLGERPLDPTIERCGSCHATAPAGQDHLFAPPR